MRTLKKILFMVGVFIAFKVIFFFAAELQRNSVQAEPSTALSQQPTPDTLPSPGHHRYVVGNGMSVELPESWHLLSSDQISAIKKRVPADGTPPNLTPLAANSDSDAQRNTGIFRASFSAASLTDADIKGASKADLDEMCHLMAGPMGESLGKLGMKIVTAPSCSVAELAGKASVVTRYQRTDGVTDAVWQVEMHQIPAGNGIAIITTSLKSGGDDKVRMQLHDALHSIRWN
ncbi:hypothetical protein I7V28_19610 [Lelliottia amnigena]|uniref:hypothetical protein n=1 Tax=Lelliottia TaxID=1330545 RepID=UPI00192ABF8D|nr:MULTISPECIES: hypothetical protein [Lelliottia]MBL5885711.1 hypothetical protein [Lelliottia aquatilis]MBL5923290.1 hypothetical protein [Lelliottia amnigena]MBL5932199.1 hypothetical protein [Lelliottia amnigena]